MRDFKLLVNILFVIYLVMPQFDAYAEKFPEDLYFLDSQNQKINIEAFDGNVVLMHFWATWCSVCINEMVELDKLQKDLRKKPFKILAISEDYKGIAAVKEFYNQHSIKNIDMYVDEKNLLFKELVIPSLPYTILIDKSGNIIEFYKGVIDWNDDTYRKTIEFELKKAEE